jgi:hypothetical protein
MLLPVSHLASVRESFSDFEEWLRFAFTDVNWDLLYGSREGVREFCAWLGITEQEIDNTLHFCAG